MDKGPSNRVLGPKSVKKTKCLPESQESTMQVMSSEALSFAFSVGDTITSAQQYL